MSATSRMKQTQVRLLNDLAIIIVILKQDVIIVEINLFYERWLIPRLDEKGPSRICIILKGQI